MDGMSRAPDFWGQFEQEKVFPPGTTLELRSYRTPRPEAAAFVYGLFVALSAAELGYISPFRDTNGDTESPPNAAARRWASSAPGRWWT